VTVAATVHVTLSLTVPGVTPLLLLAAAGAALLARRRRAPRHAHLPTSP
jgi:hypothetical protein